MATRDECLRALALHERALGRRANVVGLGIVPARDGGMAVAVYVSRKVPAADLRPQDLVPARLEVAGPPGTEGIRSVPTRVIEQGEVRLEGDT